MNYHQLIAEYYDAYRRRDRAALSSALTSDFHLVSGFGEFRGRDEMIDAIWPEVGRTWASNLRIFGEGPEFVVLYEHARTADAARPPMAMAEHIRFEGDRIAAIRVYAGWPLEGEPTRPEPGGSQP